jgi:hypothetical protein
VNRLLEQGRRLTVQVVHPKSSRGERVVQLALAEIGVHESPRDSNRGHRVGMYQASTTVPGSGWPWCMAFVRFIWDAAGVHESGYRGAYCPDFERWAKAAGHWRDASVKPRPGWAVLFDWNGDGIADHVAIVADGVPLATVEGNAQPGPGGDQSNGGGVYPRFDRKRSQVRGYVKI